MKRFFKAVERDGSFKKQALSQAAADGGGYAADGRAEKREPSKFMAWNANSFLLRLKSDRDEVLSLLLRLDPDVIAIQEVRIPAAGRKGEPKNQAEMKDDTNAAREDKQAMMRALSMPPLSDYAVWWSLADSKYGGTALFVKHCCTPLSVCFSLDQSEGSRTKHEVDGRVILAEFHSFRLLNTYVPNNGWKDEDMGFPRRRAWDQRMLEFVIRPSNKPLVWCGDLNVSHEDIDVSHPDFFRNAKLQGYTPPNPEDCGQPGFTLGERRRFARCLTDGDLVDTYRWLHKQQEMDNGFTWSGNPVGKYRGKRMRIDYFLLSRKLLDRLISSEIHGHGIDREEAASGLVQDSMAVTIALLQWSLEKPHMKQVQNIPRLRGRTWLPPRPRLLLGMPPSLELLHPAPRIVFQMLRDHISNEDPALIHTMLQEPGDETPAHFVGLLNVPRINKHPTNDSGNAMHNAL